MNLLGNETPKPTDYYVTFEGKIINSFRPERFPEVIKSSMVVRAIEKKFLVDTINKESLRIIRQGGMVITLGTTEEDPDGPSIYGSRIFVPMHMIAYITSTYKPMVGEFPITAAEAGAPQDEERDDPSFN